MICDYGTRATFSAEKLIGILCKLFRKLRSWHLIKVYRWTSDIETRMTCINYLEQKVVLEKLNVYSQKKNNSCILYNT